MTISSPFGGMESALIGVRYAPTIIPAWIDLSPNSIFLTRLLSAGVPSDIQHQMLVSVALSQNDLTSDGVVSIKSQRQIDIVNRASLIDQVDANHTTVLSHPKTQRSVSSWLINN